MKSLKPLNKPFVVLLAVYVVMWSGGIFHYVAFGKPPLDAPWAASLFLLLAGIIVLWTTSARGDWLSLLGAAALGFVSEIHGVKYGMIFSPYEYTKVLQPHLLGVPVVMFSAWLVLLAYTKQMLMPLRLNIWVESFFAAAWMTAIDLVIDPLAANPLGYWRWQQAGSYYGIPLHNFAGWFGVSLVIFLVARQRWQPNVWAQYVGLSITIFFSAIALSFGLYLSAVIGFALCLLHLGLFVARRSA